MAGPGHHLELAPADPQPVLGDETQKRPWRRGDHSQILQSVAEQELRALLGQPVGAVEGAVGLRFQALRVETDVERDQIFCLAHRQLEAKALAQPSGETDMVRVEVGGDDPRQPAPPKRPGEKRFPGGPRGRVVDPGVDEREPVAVFDQVDVDMVEPERERKSRPQDARTNFDRFAGLRRNGIGKHDRLGHCAVGHRPVSSFECGVRFDLRQPSGKKRGAPEASSWPLAPTP